LAEYGPVGAGFRVLILILLVVVIALGGLVWFDYLGVVDARQTLAPLFRLLGAKEAVVDAEDPLLLEKERLAKQVEALAFRSEELTTRQQELDRQEAELTQKIEELQNREQALDDREKVFNERVQAFDNRRDNLRQNADYLVGMPPASAVKILLEMEDQYVIDLFRVTEEQARRSGEVSLVAYWLSLMPPERAATLQRKMARKTGG
jgi:flagellar protein FlbB